MSHGVVVHDPDGVNPYGRELAGLLVSSRPVTLVIASDAEWQPDFCRTRALLPGNRGGVNRARQVLALLHGTATTAARGLLHRDTVIVVWSRSVLEDLVFALLSLLGVRVAVVVHNPVPRTPLGRPRAWSGRVLLRMATWRVTHGPQLATQVLSAVGSPAHTCMHPPYSRWWAWADPGRSGGRERVRLLSLGQLRSDKGLGDLHAALALMAPEQRARLVLCLCGRRVAGIPIPDFGALVEVDDRTSSGFLSDGQIASALAESDVLVAPLTFATQSGTVIVALSAGLTVVAYDDGEVSSVVDDEALIARGDVAALASRLTELATGKPGGGPRVPLPAWAEVSRGDWQRLVDGGR